MKTKTILGVEFELDENIKYVTRYTATIGDLVFIINKSSKLLDKAQYYAKVYHSEFEDRRVNEFSFDEKYDTMEEALLSAYIEVSKYYRYNYFRVKSLEKSFGLIKQLEDLANIKDILE